jgi:phage tail-like protein
VRIVGFGADADIVGRRVRLAWEFVLEGAETLADLPPVTVRRKTRDFEFPPPPDGRPDPFAVYDSAAFPPAGAAATELPGWETRSPQGRTVVAVETASRLVDGRAVEVGRRTTATSVDADGRPTRRRVEFLDVGDGIAGLTPETVYYYQLGSPALPPGADPRPYRDTAMATEGYGLNRSLYEALPAIYRRHDVTTRPTTAGAEAVPEAAPRSGQLRRFLDPFGAALDLMRSTAEGLRTLHDVDNTDARFLPLLSEWIGWGLSFDASVPIQRHEIRYAAALYRITGTIPGCLIWMKRLTGWDGRVKEFYPNVFFSNDLGLLERPDDRGSRTVDTSDAALLANIGTPDDRLDYTYDTGTTDDDWYAYNVVGLFLFPPPDASAADIARRRDRLKRNLSLFLPVNVRGVVVVQAPRIVEEPQAERFDFRDAITERDGGT